MGLGLLTPCHIYQSDPLSLETFSGSVHGYCLINENDVYKKQTKCSVGPGKLRSQLTKWHDTSSAKTLLKLKKWLFKNNICSRYENFNIYMLLLFHACTVSCVVLHVSIYFFLEEHIS